MDGGLELGESPLMMVTRYTRYPSNSKLFGRTALLMGVPTLWYADAVLITGLDGAICMATF